MLGLTEIKPGKVLLINAEPYVVVKADHSKKDAETVETKEEAKEEAVA